MVQFAEETFMKNGPSELRKFDKINRQCIHALHESYKDMQGSPDADKILIGLELRKQISKYYAHPEYNPSGEMDYVHNKIWWLEAKRWRKVSSQTSQSIRRRLSHIITEINTDTFYWLCMRYRMSCYSISDSVGVVFFANKRKYDPFAGGFD